MSERKNEEFFIKTVPHGKPKTDDWEKRSQDVPALEDGQVLLQSLYISVDPYLRGRLRQAKANDPMISGNVSRVVESKNDKFKVGDIVHGYLRWARFNVSDGAGLRAVPKDAAPISTANGVLGMPGMTAYFGLLDVGALKEGDEVLVSGAAGAVGSIVGQIAKIKGCRVVGTCGSAEKVDYIKSLGFDDAINYKDYPTKEDVLPVLKEKFPKGIDVFFDNTGGPVSDASFDLINKYARIAICGQIAYYNEMDSGDVMGPRHLHKLIYKSAKVQGFVVADFQARAMEFFKDVGTWIKEGKIKFTETIVDGFDTLPDTFIGLFSGVNKGKLQVKVAEE